MRNGYIQSELQIERIDSNLSIYIWDSINQFVLMRAIDIDNESYYKDYNLCNSIIKSILRGILVRPITLFENIDQAIGQFKIIFMEIDWHIKFTAIEFILAHSFRGKFSFIDFDSFINDVASGLRLHRSGYRIFENQVVPIFSGTELLALGEAIEDSPKDPKEHLKAALQHLSNRENPYYRNSITESVLAVEAMARKITGTTATLGEALRLLSGKIEIHTALQKGFSAIYGYTSDASGLRHSFTDDETDSVDKEDAIYMLVSCSAFINYLRVKASKAEIELT